MDLYYNTNKYLCIYEFYSKRIIPVGNIFYGIISVGLLSFGIFGIGLLSEEYLYHSILMTM